MAANDPIRPLIPYEDIRPVLDRMHSRTATIADFLLYIRFEMVEAMNALPPTIPDNKSDGFHAGCCALRAFAAMFQLERLIKQEDRTNK